MNEFKGTPGPWKIISGKLGDDGSEIEAENSAFWAFVSFDTPEAERIPNANLIAAAPELLEAREALLDYAESGWDHFPDVAVNARAAISKALGK